MIEHVHPMEADAGLAHVRTPAGLQDRRIVTRRRRIVFALNLVSMLAVLAGLVVVFGVGGWNVTDIVIVVCVCIGAPWTIMGFWNAVIGLWLMHGVRDGLERAAPQMVDADATAPISTRTALTMFLRNEPPEPSIARLVEMRRSLDATGWGGHFDIYILSDTDDEQIAQQERQAFDKAQGLLAPTAIYRRRTNNIGYKSGNLRDFLRHWGRRYDYFLPLDTDSLMSGAAMVRMVRILQAHPRIGILQSLVVGAPATSAFARIFQFGMRHGMRSFTLGAAWWHADCGPYWGHNALIRVDAFRKHCRLPTLPGGSPLGGHILSHDQVEAVLMRRGGFECRVMPVEGESWEENPPTLLDFTKRDLRWCQGNMQYGRILFWRGLKPMSRFQIFAAMMMYFGAPAWMLITGAAALKLMHGLDQQVNVAFGLSMFFVMIGMSLFPKIAGWIDVALRPGAVASYGGRVRFALGALTETVFSMLLAPVVAFRVTLFLIGLAFGRSVIWGGQNRDPYALPWRDAVAGLWPQTVAGSVLGGLLLWLEPAALPWAAAVLAGLALAIPFALLTALPEAGRWMYRRGLCATPDEVQPNPVLHGAQMGSPPRTVPSPRAA
ncbi:glucans biosynthesis glucosyltransferase MdoH [Pontivivens nitratireducens]|uniref:Glucans biosynthesis glucosyltransferase H n=1 Tax=Pontivivens nitratireducens TaxID=2758038 RepID=A0A6G7VP27_9RHOB|nr:glucans biosynthesis glucosyltransferase MdoH [Pontibrevibacter nitratireducens]QIK41771.1 glucans biosynthesis glucosyltransferase MdoH [Pontibrevibacter nitratireducens]